MDITNVLEFSKSFIQLHTSLHFLPVALRHHGNFLYTGCIKIMCPILNLISWCFWCQLFKCRTVSKSCKFYLLPHWTILVNWKQSYSSFYWRTWFFLTRNSTKFRLTKCYLVYFVSMSVSRSLCVSPGEINTNTKTKITSAKSCKLFINKCTKQQSLLKCLHIRNILGFSELYCAVSPFLVLIIKSISGWLHSGKILHQNVTTPTMLDSCHCRS